MCPGALITRTPNVLPCRQTVAKLAPRNLIKHKIARLFFGTPRCNVKRAGSKAGAKQTNYCLLFNSYRNPAAAPAFATTASGRLAGRAPRSIGQQSPTGQGSHVQEPIHLAGGGAHSVRSQKTEIIMKSTIPDLPCYI